MYRIGVVQLRALITPGSGIESEIQVASLGSARPPMCCRVAELMVSSPRGSYLRRQSLRRSHSFKPRSYSGHLSLRYTSTYRGGRDRTDGGRVSLDCIFYVLFPSVLRSCMVMVLAVYVLAGTVAPAVGWLLGGAIASLFAGGDVWLGRGYLIMSGPPYTGRLPNAILHGALSALKAASSALAACGVALILGGRPGWSLLMAAILPVTLWRTLQLPSVFRRVETPLGAGRSESDRGGTLGLVRQRKIVELVCYVFGALCVGILVVHRP